ncbi:GTP-dependent dephospho-CoA kinase family protein [Halobacteria archaeon HArc-gm2]|nr:GTP-dependent dephospho-CoA kinase family protein [Halobacteria archaeon HArc-gm2]
MSDVVLELPDALRGELKDPLGPIYTDAETLLSAATEPIVAVGDVVTYHLLQADHVPAVAFVDEKTKRQTVDEEIREGITGFDRERTIDNPAATLTSDLLETLRTGIDEAGTTLVRVDGEEDLAALPAILAVPEGASVVYGQPDEGMVLVRADEESREFVRDLLAQMDGDSETALALLD